MRLIVLAALTAIVLIPMACGGPRRPVKRPAATAASSQKRPTPVTPSGNGESTSLPEGTAAENGVGGTAKATQNPGSETSPPAVKEPFDAVAAARRGKDTFKKKNCNFCHKTTGFIATRGPNLKGVGKRLTRERMDTWIRDPSSLKPGTQMLPFQGTDDELRDVIEYMQSLR